MTTDIWCLNIVASNTLKYISFPSVHKALNTPERHYFDVQISVQRNVIPIDIPAVHPNTGNASGSHIL